MPHHRSTPALAAALALVIGACDAGAPKADLIITNGAVYTMNWPEPAPDGTPSPQSPFDSTRGGWRPDAEAVAVRGGRIVFVGSDSGAIALRGPSTRVVDAHGGAVLPGLVDAHVHLANLGASLRRVNLIGVATEQDAIARVVERAATTPAGEWIIGYGWDEGAWANRYPDLRLLSERVPNHPVWLVGLHTFAGWGNRLAMERAGITASTRAPDGGEIRKDAAGQPTGILLNNAVRLVDAVIPRPTDSEMDARMLAGLGALVKAGYTSVHDGNTDAEMLASLERLAAANRLPIPVWVLVASSDTALLRHWIARGPDTSRTNLIVRGVKAFYDGALGSRGALLLADYSDRAGHRGRGGADIGFNEQLLIDAVGRGFQLSIHAIGDAANRATLDFYERALAAHPAARNGRHRIEHAQVVALNDIPRFAKLGIIASMQPGHAVEDKAWAEQRVGSARIKGAYAWRSLRVSGAALLFNSDLPGSSYDIYYMLHSAITRRDPELKPDSGWYPAERMTIEEAVRGYTTWAAYASFAERDAGQLAVGRRADITILDADLFRVASRDPARLLGGAVRMTIAGGRILHEREAH